MEKVKRIVAFCLVAALMLSLVGCKDEYGKHSIETTSSYDEADVRYITELGEETLELFTQYESKFWDVKKTVSDFSVANSTKWSFRNFSDVEDAFDEMVELQNKLQPKIEELYLNCEKIGWKFTESYEGCANQLTYMQNKLDEVISNILDGYDIIVESDGKQTADVVMELMAIDLRNSIECEKMRSSIISVNGSGLFGFQYELEAYLDK